MEVIKDLAGVFRWSDIGGNQNKVSLVKTMENMSLVNFVLYMSLNRLGVVHRKESGLHFSYFCADPVCQVLL